MRALLLALTLCLAGSAWAGENAHLGSIVVSGASLTNVTTAVPFVIPLNSKITLYCTAAVQVLTDQFVVTVGTAGTKGVPVNAATLFPTSVTKRMSQVSGRDTAVIAIIGTATCDVWQRTGGE
jgi:hypothetical protein